MKNKKNNNTNTTMVTTAPTSDRNTLSKTSPKTNKKIMATTLTTAGSNTVIMETANAAFLQSKVAEQAAFIDELSTLVKALDSNINWNTKTPMSKIRRFGLFITSNWDDIFNIIAAIIKLINTRK